MGPMSSEHPVGHGRDIEVVGVDGGIGDFFIEVGAVEGLCGEDVERMVAQERPVISGLDPAGQGGRIGTEPDDEGLTQGGADGGVQHRTSGGGQHGGKFGADRVEHHLRFEVPVGRLTARLPDFAHREAGFGGDGDIDVDHPPAHLLGDQAADVGLPGSHEPDEHEDGHGATPNARRARV